jgi:hypothetical protein
MTIESVSTGASPTAELLLREVAARAASGVLEVRHPDQVCSHVWVRAGRIYAMHVPGYRPALGIRLLSGGLVSPEQLSAAAALQREQHPTMLIGQVLVELGYVAPDVVRTFVQEQVLDQVADLLDLTIESAAFHPGRRVQHDVIQPTDVDTLLAVARERRARRADVLAAVGGRHAVPQLGAPGTHPNRTPLGPYDWALLCRVDGRRDITELARVCGYTLQEAAQIVADLTLTGLLELPEPAPAPEEPLAPVLPLRSAAPTEPPPPPEWRFDGTDAGEPEPVGAPPAHVPPHGDGATEGLLAELSAFVHDEPVRAVAPVEPPAAPAEAVAPVSPIELVDPVEPPAEALVPAPELEAALEPIELVDPAPAPAPLDAAVAAAPEIADVAAAAAPEPAAPVEEPVPHTGLAEAPPLDPHVPDGVHASIAASAAHEDHAPPVQPALAALALVSAPAPDRPMATRTAPAPPQPAQHMAAQHMAAQPESPAQPLFPAGAPVAPPSESGYTDTSLFMRELSSLSDAPEQTDAPVVTRLVVPLTPQPRKRRFWGR